MLNKNRFLILDQVGNLISSESILGFPKKRRRQLIEQVLPCFLHLLFQKVFSYGSQQYLRKYLAIWQSDDMLNRLP